MMNTLKSLALAAALAVPGVSASAATIPVLLGSPDESITIANDVLSGDTLTYEFTASTALRVRDPIRAGASGTNGGLDIASLLVGVNGDLAVFDFTTGIGGPTGAGLGAFAGFVLAAGDTFTFTFDNTGGAETVGTTVSFETAAVPVPAAGLLLLTALAGGAVAARRKKKA